MLFNLCIFYKCLVKIIIELNLWPSEVLGLGRNHSVFHLRITSLLPRQEHKPRYQHKNNNCLVQGHFNRQLSLETEQLTEQFTDTHLTNWAKSASKGLRKTFPNNSLLLNCLIHNVKAIFTAYEHPRQKKKETSIFLVIFLDASALSKLYNDIINIIFKYNPMRIGSEKNVINFSTFRRRDSILPRI